MRYFVQISTSPSGEFSYFVADKFNIAPQDQQNYGNCVLYILKHLILISREDVGNFFWDYVDDDEILELTNNGPVEFISSLILLQEEH